MSSQYLGLWFLFFPSLGSHFAWSLVRCIQAQKAARGTDNRAYPWGKDWDPTRLNWGDAKGQTDGHEGPAPVGTYETGKSPFGCYDMAGNVLEWCADLFDPTRGSSRSVRGGSCIEKMWVRTWTRDFEAPNQLMSRLGFRCVADGK